MENRPEERAELEARGLHALEHPEPPEPREWGQRFAPIVRLWRYPAFGAYTAWTLFAVTPRPGDREEPEVVHIREVTWDRPYDMGRFADPLEGVRRGFRAPPTIRERDGELPEGEWRAWRDGMARVAIPLVGVEGVVGLDGETFGIETYDGFNVFRLGWWCDGPREWWPFVRAVGRLREMMEARLGPSG
jgi:hypothetical protein